MLKYVLIINSIVLYCIIVLLTYVIARRMCSIKFANESSANEFASKSSSEGFKVKSKVDNHTYDVKDMDQSQIAADKLAVINQRISKLISHLEAKYGKDHPNTRLLSDRYNAGALHEHTPYFFNSNVAFTMQKGRSLGICMRNLESADKSFHKLDNIMFVMLHEIAHIATNASQHPPEFWSLFKFILHEAAEAGVYTPIDYRNNPIVYCDGTEIAYNPYFDTSLDISQFQK